MRKHCPHLPLFHENLSEAWKMSLWCFTVGNRIGQQRCQELGFVMETHRSRTSKPRGSIPQEKGPYGSSPLRPPLQPLQGRNLLLPLWPGLAGPPLFHEIEIKPDGLKTYCEGPSRAVGSRKKPSWGDCSQQINLASVTLQKLTENMLYIKYIHLKKNNTADLSGKQTNAQHPGLAG